MNQKVDTYLEEGCGRCSFWRTPECKVHTWGDELTLLRGIVLDCGLTEEVKWGVPCYTVNNRNVLLLSAYKNSCVLSFVKGSMLADKQNILVKPGKNTQSGRVIRFTSVDQIIEMKPTLKAYILEAVEVEKSGRKDPDAKAPEMEIPDELQHKLDEDPVLKKAFSSLTPGRQRGYVLYFSAAKQSSTRQSRVEKCIPKILEGKGLHDR